MTVLLICLVSYSFPGFSQSTSVLQSGKYEIEGSVLDLNGQVVGGATVHLKYEGDSRSEDKVTSGNGTFLFRMADSGNVSLTAEKAGKQSNPFKLTVVQPMPRAKIELVLGKTDSSENLSSEAMQFADQPNFTVAGVTDFTAAGGHGSDSSLRTSEALARETSNLERGALSNSSHSSFGSGGSEETLKAALRTAPESFDANYSLGDYYLRAERYSDAIPFLQKAYQLQSTNNKNEYDLALACRGVGDFAHSRSYVAELIARHESADLYHLAAQLDESLGDPLAAVREYQKAATLDPSEQNYFSWGSELLLHRAIWQAQKVFEQGSKRFPASSRLLTGLGTALFAGAAYGEAALKLCQASDMNPLDEQPYLFLGKVQIAAPEQLPCIRQKLLRFVQQQPGNADANYLYAMALQKASGDGEASNPAQQPESFLKKAIAINPKYADAYLQLGILYASKKSYGQAIDQYTKAIAANPDLSDAYYRLAVAYDRTGQAAKAPEEFKLHDQVAKKQAAEIERQRLEVKQFLVVLPSDASRPATP